MGILEVRYCPNPECEQEKLKEGERCPKCGSLAQKFGIRQASNLLYQKGLAKKSHKTQPAKIADTNVPMTSNHEKAFLLRGMTESEYAACINNLGLLEGEEVKLQYICSRNVISPPSAIRALFTDDGGVPRMESKKGLLVFTNDNMIFMQQEGAWSSNYAQALRISLEQISGIVSGGSFVKHVRITTGVGGSLAQHEFINFVSTYGKQEIHEVRADIESHLKKMREKKKQLAQEALAKGIAPTMIFCKYCGARNKADQTSCVNCGALLA